MICTIISSGFEKKSPCKNEHEEPYASLKKKLRRIIWSTFCEGYTEFYVNCEYGVPLWTAEIICELKDYNKISLHIVVPHEEQCKNWEESLRDRYYAVHKQADSITFASKKFHFNCYEDADDIMFAASRKIIFIGKYSDETKKGDFFNVF